MNHLKSVLKLGLLLGTVFTANAHADPSCPPGMIFDRVIGRCVTPRRVPIPPPPGGRPVPIPVPTRLPAPPVPIPMPPPSHDVPSNGRVMQPQPPTSMELEELVVARFANEAMSGVSCANAGDALRNLSNQLLSSATSISRPPSGRRGETESQRQWRAFFRSPQFWKKVWMRMADAYRSCDRGCFDDGLAVGQISAAGYCAASVALSGLPGVGYLEQPPLPVCGSAIYTGCVKSYRETSISFPGCSAYAESGWTQTFNEYVSQDCHL